ncbi:CHASE domain-containing protein [Mycobacterium sp. CVI_P3]|uniref:histidine kinase n=1 Tax=Mycobacterium pinniadriaticum TaxID=2994102 RepID=A0ABT3SE25_9MYCO|nr:CHASE domain-containing protein [Mycobacterium pinniadriaticum]MCX2931321.1 CHASE domain-containing protein [Mycobacterium pinniadriaticum]MCX2937745.1 CHASE domain-containing protein [Mycobacterium pinniadriaticum]
MSPVSQQDSAGAGLRCLRCLGGRYGSTRTTIGLIVLAVAAIGVISVAYWLLGGTLQSTPPPLVPEYLGAAIAFGFIGMAIWILYLRTPARPTLHLITAGLTLLGVITAAVWLGPLSAVSEPDAVHVFRGPAPFISQLAAFGATLLCGALLLKMLQEKSTAARVIAEAFVLAAFFLGVSAVIVYAYGEDLSAPLALLRKVRVPAALSITLLTVAIAVGEQRWAIHRLVRRMGWGAGLFFAVLFVLLALTGLMWRIAQSDAKNQLSVRFDSDVQTMQYLVESHLNSDIKALKGGASLFAASEDVDRASWKAYVDGLNLARDYPGVQGFGYAVVLDRDQLAEVENSVRAEGFPKFSIFPLEPIRDVYTAIIYLEPFDARNQRAFGYDMFSEAVRRDAMTRARDSGEPAMSSAVLLLQEIESRTQRGFLIYEPVYRRGSSPDTVAERIADIQGYVYSPFRMNDFLDAAIGNQFSNIRLEVFDQDPSDPEALLEDNRMYGEALGADRGSGPSTVQELSTGGHTWLLRFTATPGYIPREDTYRARLVLFSGLTVSIALALATYFLASSRQRAVSIANVLTEDLASERDAALLEQKKDEMLLNGIIEAMIVVSPGGVIERINAAAEAILRADEAQLLGKHYRDVLIAYQEDGQPYPAAERPIEAALQDRLRTANAVVHYRRADGNSFPALVSVAPLIHNNELFGAIEILRDITEERRLDKAKDEFLSVASHQLRTPITAQGWLLDILTDPETVGRLSDQQLDIAQKLIKSNDRLSDLVTALLNVSRLESGRLTVAPVPTDLAELTNSVLDEVAVEVAPRRQRIIVHAERLPDINIDPVLIRQVIVNLVTNASKYSPDESEIEISIEQRDADIVFTITDHGYGIPASQRERVFSKFFRSENILDKQTDGNGLGLYLVKSIVELSGGSISFESVEGRGTTFCFTLPLAGSPAHEGEVRFGPSSLDRV